MSLAVELFTEIPFWVFDTLEDDTPLRRFWVTKGLGSGGTYGTAIWHVRMCMINHRSKYSWAVAPTYTQVENTLIPTFTEVLYTHFGMTVGEDFKIILSRRPRIVFKWGQEIHFFGADNPERFVGPSISHCSGTELGLWKRMAYEKSWARCRCPNAERIQYLGEGTPEGFNWWEKEANFEGVIDDARNYKRIILYTEDNPHLPAGYVQQLRQTYEYDPAKLESYLFGKFVSFAKGTAYWEFFESRAVVLDVKPSPYLPILFTFDFGSPSNTAWAAMQRQRFSKRGVDYQRFVVLAESDGKQRGLMDCVAEFAAHFPPEIYRDTPIHIDGGADGYAEHIQAPACSFDQISDYLRKWYKNVQVTAARSAPTIQARLNQVAAVMAYEQFVVAAWCRNSINSLLQSRLKEGSWQLEKPKGADFTHFADAICNPIYRLTKDESLENPNAVRSHGFNR